MENNKSTRTNIPETYYPRKCILLKSPENAGFGFSLETKQAISSNSPKTKTKTTNKSLKQYKSTENILNGEAGKFSISKIVPNSPADKAGLLQGDYILKVNGNIVSTDTLRDVDMKIKACGDLVALVAIRPEGYQFFHVNRVDIAAKYKRYLKVWSEVKTCFLKKRRGFPGYGFVLQTSEDGKVYADCVEKNSPAQSAGLASGDRVALVNAVNVGHESRSEIVDRIREIETEVWLTVITKPVTC